MRPQRSGPILPVQCDACRRWFGIVNPIEVTGGGSVSVQFTGTRMGPCPYCGGMGTVRDGVYRFAADSIDLIRAIATTSPDQIDALRRVFEGARDRDSNASEIAARIDSEAPAFAALKSLLPEGRLEIQNYIMIILAALSVLLGWKALNPKEPPPPTIQIFNQITQVNNAPQANPATKPLAVEARHPKQSRNALCSCGSGTKYKRCHGALR